MSFYELSAEGKGYFHFKHRAVCETKPHFHGAPEFLFVKSGEQEVTLDGETRILQAGEGCFCDSFTLHAYTPTTDVVAFVLLGEKKYFEETFSAFGDKAPPPFFRFDNFDLLENLCSLCKENRSNPVATQEIFYGSVKILLADLAERVPFQPRKKDRANALVCRILRYADQHHADDLSLHTIAQQFGYSSEYLSRLLHKYLSQTWNTYVNSLRARRADFLLQSQPSSTVLEIAYDCGFDSPNTFYRAYKKEFGYPPRRMKR